MTQTFNRKVTKAKATAIAKLNRKKRQALNHLVCLMFYTHQCDCVDCEEYKAEIKTWIMSNFKKSYLAKRGIKWPQ